MESFYKNLSEKYFTFLLEGNRTAAAALCHTALKEEIGVKELYELIIKPALYKIGLFWEQNRISVAAEHLATAITEGILNEIYPDLITGDYQGKKIVLACVNGEEHQVGIKMVADIFELHGWETFFTGQGIPTSDLIPFIKTINPQILAISLSVFFNYQNYIKMISNIRNELPDLKILIGGQAFNHIKKEDISETENINYLKSLNDLEDYINKL